MARLTLTFRNRVLQFVSSPFVKILMIAPEPFFEPRGTPFSEYHRIRASLELGHTVDLVTYPFGKRRGAARAARCSGACGRRSSTTSRIGPSSAKVPLDRRAGVDGDPPGGDRSGTTRSTRTRKAASSACSLAAAAGHAAPLRHALEPAAAARQLRLQPKSRLLTRAFSWMERLVIRRSTRRDRDLPAPRGNRARHRRDVPTVLIENAPGPATRRREGSGARDSRRASGWPPRRRWSSTPARSRPIRGSTCCSPRRARRRPRGPDVRFVLAGGRPEQIAAARASRRARGRGRQRDRSPVSGRPRRFRRTSTRRTCSSRRAAPARTRRSRSISTCDPAVRSWRRGS